MGCIQRGDSSCGPALYANSRSRRRWSCMAALPRYGHGWATEICCRGPNRFSTKLNHWRTGKTNPPVDPVNARRYPRAWIRFNNRLGGPMADIDHLLSQLTSRVGDRCWAIVQLQESTDDRVILTFIRV